MSFTEETHAHFLAALDKSEKFRWLAAMVLVGQGNTVTVPPMTKAPRHEDRAEHSDHGDLFIKEGIVAVKSSNYDWSCYEDWPFKGRYIVAPVKEIDNHQPLWIMDFNKAGTHYGKVCLLTSDHWWKENKPGQMAIDNDISNMCYLCHPKIVEFHKVNL